MRQAENWAKLPMSSKESLELIVSHIGKILNGDHFDAKHWNDIATLARIVGKQLEPLKMPRAAGLRAVETVVEDFRDGA